MCFSDNRDKVELAFRDYMNQYFSEVEKKDGFPYDKTLGFAEKEKKVDALMLGEISKLAGVDLSNKSISVEMFSRNLKMSEDLYRSFRRVALFQEFGTWWAKRLPGYRFQF